jgi:outer membrane immunogenic protein
MRTILSLLVVGAAWSGSAGAADLPVKAPIAPIVAESSWSGPYLGVRGGWGWGETTFTNLGGSAAGATFGGVTVPFSNSFGAIGREVSHKPHGGIIGYVSGINWQTGNFVYGIEQTLAWTRIKGDTGVVGFPVPPAAFVPTGVLGSELRWYGTVDSRFGLVLGGNSLIYVKGGAAFGELRVTGRRTNGTALGDNFSQKDLRAGWTVGGGWDYMLTRNWIFGIDGSYVNLGREAAAGQTVDAAGVGGAGGYNESVRFNFVTVQGRLTYRWGQ